MFFDVPWPWTLSIAGNYPLLGHSIITVPLCEENAIQGCWIMLTAGTNHRPIIMGWSVSDKSFERDIYRYHKMVSQQRTLAKILLLYKTNLKRTGKQPKLQIDPC